MEIPHRFAAELTTGGLLCRLVKGRQMMVADVLQNRRQFSLFFSLMNEWKEQWAASSLLIIN